MTNITEQDLSPVEHKVLEALQKVIDPELGIDLVNLGLVYGINVDESGKCLVTMTLTMMGCPLTDVLNHDITTAVEAVNGVNQCQIKVVWEPAWGPDKMSRFARMALGVHF